MFTNDHGNLDYILDRRRNALERGIGFSSPEITYNRYAVSIFRGGIGKTTLTFNLAYELSRRETLLVADLCPQRNLSELLLGGDLRSTEPTIYEALLPAVANGIPDVPAGSLGKRISQSCKDFGSGKKSFVIASSNELFLFASSLYGSLSRLSVLREGPRLKSMQSTLHKLDSILKAESAELGTKMTLIDTSPFFAGGTHLAWMASDALVVPVRVDQSSIEALELTLQMLEDPSMEYLRFRKDAGIESKSLKIQAIPITHCGWSRKRGPNIPDNSTQAFVKKIARMIAKKAHLFSFKNPLDSIVLINDFHSAGRISGVLRRPLSTLRVGQRVMFEGKRLEVNQSLERYQGEIKLLASLL